jgi:monovalent cation/proton antiporter MnhG/PhaG subunit
MDMMFHQSAVIALLVVGVGAQLLCCIGIFTMDRVLDRLNYAGPASTVGPLAIACAVLLEESFSTAGLKTLLIAALLIIEGPILTHAIARTARGRRAERASRRRATEEDS